MRPAQAHNTHQPGNTSPRAPASSSPACHATNPQPRLTSKQAKLARRTCAERAKLKMRTVLANTYPNHDLAHELVPEIGSCTARARHTSLLSMPISKSVTSCRITSD